MGAGYYRDVILLLLVVCDDSGQRRLQRAERWCMGGGTQKRVAAECSFRRETSRIEVCVEFAGISTWPTV